MELVVKRLEEKKQGDLQVFNWFRTHVINSKLEPSIEHQELVSVSNINRSTCISYHFYSTLCFPPIRDISKNSQTYTKNASF